MASDATARRVGREDLTGWYRLSTKPAIAARQAETLIDRWGAPCRWPSIDGVLSAADPEGRAA
ncbi:hypothetical protein [Nocardiopsis sp. NRRL B-16309]|uniref:hypothetical protein n=1 Tax=Nocardiopsis sp. NRRL B-16309 TaxID=1519494 RepID=UPI0006AF5C3B|nr:hypothetical protein [Nocardiopsis sp. NRRL B-16309]KOX10105.1 hypothetical protein ADL05_25820 [Nocardiopsis sp. NRRL B-16309]